MIRVVVADDHHLVRQGIRALLERASVQVIGEASNGHEAVELADQTRPDVIILDLSMPRLDGVQASERILALGAHIAIVILSMHADTAMVQQLLRMGVKGYLLKNAISDELVLAVNTAAQGRVYLSPTISDSVMSLLLSPADHENIGSMADLLTAREREVLQLVAEGYTNTAIADMLTISVKTVEKHRANLMAKLQVNDLPSLILAAVKHGLIFIEK